MAFFLTSGGLLIPNVRNRRREAKTPTTEKHTSEALQGSRTRICISRVSAFSGENRSGGMVSGGGRERGVALYDEQLVHDSAEGHVDAQDEADDEEADNDGYERHVDFA